MSRCARFESGSASEPNRANRVARFEKAKTFEKIVKTSQRIERNLGLRFGSCDFKSLRIAAIRSAVNCAPRIGTSKGYFQTRTTSTNTFGSGYLPVGRGSSAWKGKGWEPKSLVCPSKPWENKLLAGYPGILAGISRDFGWDIPEVPERFEK